MRNSRYEIILLKAHVRTKVGKENVSVKKDGWENFAPSLHAMEQKFVKTEVILFILKVFVL